MKKLLMIMLILLTVGVFAKYNVGDTVDPADNISWTITGPTGHPEVGNSSNLFNMASVGGKPIMIFFGQSW